MKRARLLNRHVSALVAELGHLDEVVVADAGLPTPNGVPVIDLAVRPNTPTLFQVLEAIKSETVVQEVIYATECRAEFANKLTNAFDSWKTEQGQEMAIKTTSHVAFKERSKGARAIIRTGDFTPYANVILVSGVPF